MFVAERNSLFWREPKVVGLLNIRKQITEIFELAFVKPGEIFLYRICFCLQQYIKDFCFAILGFLPL